MKPGDPVQVRSTFTNGWVRGFEVAELARVGNKSAVRLRRRSDGEVLPTPFFADSIQRDTR